MRHLLNGPLKEHIVKIKRRTDKERLTETTIITRASIHTYKTKHQNKV